MEPLRLRSNDLIDIGLYVSVTKSTSPNFGKRLKTAQRSVLNGLVKEQIALMTFLTFISLSTICDGRSSLSGDDSSDIYITGQKGIK